MKILFIIGRLDTPGGEERSLSLLCNELARRGYDITVACLEGGRAYYPLDDAITVIYLPVYSAWRAARVRYLLKYVKNASFDIITGYGATARLPAAITGKRVKVPVIYCERLHPLRHNNDTLKRKLWRILGMCLLRGQYGVFQTSEVMQLYKGLKKAVVIPNMLDCAKLPDVKPWQERNNVILSAGRLTAQKNIDMLIRAYVNYDRHRGLRAAVSRTSVKLEIYGDGEQRERLEKLITELNTGEHITLHPASPDIFEIMNKAKIYVCSSNIEGYPNALTEAMAMGMACISTQCSEAVTELIKDGENGITVPVNDADAVTKALTTLVSDDDCARRIGEKAAKVRETNAKEVIIGNWISFFDAADADCRGGSLPPLHRGGK